MNKKTLVIGLLLFFTKTYSLDTSIPTIQQAEKRLSEAEARYSQSRKELAEAEAGLAEKEKKLVDDHDLLIRECIDSRHKQGILDTAPCKALRALEEHLIKKGLIEEYQRYLQN